MVLDLRHRLDTASAYGAGFLRLECLNCKLTKEDHYASY
jgi:hypothetical protein